MTTPTAGATVIEGAEVLRERAHDLIAAAEMFGVDMARRIRLQRGELDRGFRMRGRLQ